MKIKTNIRAGAKFINHDSPPPDRCGGRYSKP